MFSTKGDGHEFRDYLREVESAFAERLFVEKRSNLEVEGTIRSFRTVNTFNQYAQWLVEVFPEVLWGLTAEHNRFVGFELLGLVVYSIPCRRLLEDMC